MAVINNKMALYRRRAHLTLRDVAGLIDVDASKIENGKRRISERILTFYQEVLGMNQIPKSMSYQHKHLRVRQNTLAIFLRARRVGLSYFTKQSGHFISIIMHKQKGENCIKKIKNLIKTGEVKTIIISKVPKHPKSNNFNTSLLKQIQKLSKKDGIEIHSYSRKNIQTTFQQFGVKYKYDIAVLLRAWIPFLRKDKLPSRGTSILGWHTDAMYGAVSLVVVYNKINLD